MKRTDTGSDMRKRLKKLEKELREVKTKVETKGGREELHMFCDVSNEGFGFTIYKHTGRQKEKEKGQKRKETRGRW